MNTSPLTELDAVNIILRNDGEAPVASLDESGFSEAADAAAALEEVSRTVQDGGWAFNTDYSRKMLPDVSQEIVLPDTTLWIRPTYVSANLSVVERGRKLYDLSNNTYEFKQAVYLDICQMLDFTELPSSARYYITLRAARLYQARSTGSPRQNSLTEIDEMRAQASLKKADNRARPRGHFRTARGRRDILRRPI